jgi:MFS family permease
VLSLYLQEVLEYGPAASGLALTLLGVAGVGAGSAAPIVARRLGLRRGLVAALVVQAGGVALLMPMGADRGLQPILVGTAVIGAGHFGATVLFTALATSAVGEGQRGVVIGLVSSGQQIGAALGLALLVGVASLGAVGTRTDASLVEGFQRALVVGVGMSLLGAALVLTLTRESDRRSPHGSRTGRCPEH